MRPKRRAAPALLAAVLLAFAGGAPAAWGPAGGPLRAYLPDARAVPGWAPDGGPQEFEGEDLFAYIDGGAEIYEEYGFRRVAVQDYKDGGGKSLSLEVFEMETPAAAFGMFTFKRSGRGRSLALGGGGEIESYYLNFWKGRFLVTLTGFDETPGTRAGLEAVAAAVETRIGDGGEAPRLAGLLPGRGLRTESVKYVRGRLGLANAYDLHAARGLDFAEAVKGDYEDGTALIVLAYASPQAQADAWAELRGEIARGGWFERTDAEAVYRDGRGRFAAFAPGPEVLAVALGADAAAARRRAESAAAGTR